MKLYQFTLPTHTNAGLSYELARKRWEAHAIAAAGGITKAPGFSEGVWRSGGRDYRETVALYTVACEPATFKLLLAHAFDMFPDQLAIFTVELGNANVNERPLAAAAS